MFGFRPKLPIAEEQRRWIDDSFLRLSRILGHDRMLRAQVILPAPEYFPDRYDGTEATLDDLFRRVCDYMGVERRRIDLEIFDDHSERLREFLPVWHSEAGGAAGFYTHDEDRSRAVIAIKCEKLRDPLALVATLAHELGHVILL